MSLQTPVTIRDALGRIHSGEFVFPSSHKPCVWRARKIELLIDSAMRGWSIGSFKGRRVRADDKRYRPYDFDFTSPLHGYRHPGRDSLNGKGKGAPTRRKVTAVLDGIERLTVLKVALQGAYADEQPGRQDPPGEGPVRLLCLNLFREASGTTRGTRYDLRFLTGEDAAASDDTRCWYPVPQVLAARRKKDISEYLAERLGHMTRAELKAPLAILDALREAVHVKPVIRFRPAD